MPINLSIAAKCQLTTSKYLAVLSTSERAVLKFSASGVVDEGGGMEVFVRKSIVNLEQTGTEVVILGDN